MQIAAQLLQRIIVKGIDIGKGWNALFKNLCLIVFTGG